MFLHVSVILFTGGVSGEPPRDQADTPLAGRTPRTSQTPPGRENPPWDQGEPPGTRQIPPHRENPPRDQADTPPAGRTPPPDQGDLPREEDCSIRSMSGRYASYWNAFLSAIEIFSKKTAACSYVNLGSIGIPVKIKFYYFPLI